MKLNHPKIVTKMKVFYSRVSTEDQKIDRQMKNLEGFDYVLSDYCSGSIPIWERPKGSEIKKLIDEGKLTHLEVHSIDRLGRNTISVLQVWKDLTEMGIRIVCRTPNFQNLTDEGKTDMFSELMISILSTMSDFERKLISEGYIYKDDEDSTNCYLYEGDIPPLLKMFHIKEISTNNCIFVKYFFSFIISQSI